MTCAGTPDSGIAITSPLRITQANATAAAEELCAAPICTPVCGRARLPEFDKPTLIAWSADDVFFEVGDGEKLAEILPNARLEIIDGARTFSMLDRPDRLADLMSTLAVRA